MKCFLPAILWCIANGDNMDEPDELSISSMIKNNLTGIGEST